MFSIETLERILKCKLFTIERAEKYRRTIRKWQNSIIIGATRYADISIDMLDEYIGNVRKVGKDEDHQDRSDRSRSA